MNNKRKQLFEKGIKPYCLWQVSVSSVSVLLMAILQLILFPHLRLLEAAYYYPAGFYFLTGVAGFVLHIFHATSSEAPSRQIESLYHAFPYLRLLLCLLIILSFVSHHVIYIPLFPLQMAACFLIQLLFERVYYGRKSKTKY
ncbi:MAG: hypothetical protein NC388_01870 [Clostridium sp.]|nr:hypothetical protein [Clostridium sp.]